MKKSRRRWVSLGKCAFVGILLTVYFFFLPKAFWALFALHITFVLGYNLLFAMLETFWLDGATCLTQKDRRDILKCLAHLTEDDSIELRRSLPELRALSTGSFTETSEIRQAAAVIVKRLEGSSQTLPIPAGHSSTDTAILPISASSD